jgi:hypothetical protein
MQGFLKFGGAFLYSALQGGIEGLQFGASFIDFADFFL